jgi:hypothetical protein
MGLFVAYQRKVYMVVKVVFGTSRGNLRPRRFFLAFHFPTARGTILFYLQQKGFARVPRWLQWRKWVLGCGQPHIPKDISTNVAYEKIEKRIF